MSKLKLIGFALPLFLLFASPYASAPKAFGAANKTLQSQGQTGTLQKMIVENGSVTMDLDLNRLNGINSASQSLQEAHFAVGANSFFPILVFNDLLRGATPGTMALIPQSVPTFSGALGASFNRLVVEKLPSGQGFDLAVRDGNTGFTFFNIQGHQYDYDPTAKSLTITEGRLLVSKEFANALGRPTDAGAAVGTVSVGAAMQPIEITQLANGQPQSLVMPPLQHTLGPDTPNAVPGPDVIVGNIEDVDRPGKQRDTGWSGHRNRFL